MPIKDYSTTASSNGTISSINIAEGCNPGNINNAIRQLMADIAGESVSTSTIASAATIDLGAQAGSVTITGTIAITSFGTAPAGLLRRVYFTGSLVLTHNATSLILKGGANITTANGDFALFESLGSGNWRMLDYSKVDGTPLTISIPGNFDNPLLNADFGLWQRGTSLTISAGAQGYLADRWVCYSASAGTYSRQVDAPSGFQYSIDVNAGAGQIFQRIESVVARNLSGKTVTVTICAKKISGAAAINCTLYSCTGTDNFASIALVSSLQLAADLTSGFAEYKATFTNLSANVANGLLVGIIPSTAINYRLAWVKIEEGTGTPGYKPRPPALELALCQRYYEKSYNVDVNPGAASYAGVAFGMTNPGGWIAYLIRFAAHKRAQPTMTFYHPDTGAVGSWRDGSGNNGNVSTTWSVSSYLGRGGIGVFGSGYAGNVICWGHWAADAEL